MLACQIFRLQMSLSKGGKRQNGEFSDCENNKHFDNLVCSITFSYIILKELCVIILNKDIGRIIYDGQLTILWI